ncbi:heptosyltransferase-1/heptosyltransferase-2 [Singulisphaera sp. GP187]|uniref:glycosyltransferase family 9 protein n=1 Tax=Singulisphaera sp. GP187 TaxID=1882752 RepID=UPI000925ACAA|nr:glycosyltransferase family 9 protein [Singulisphaera sp. GP187]SIO67514.1 heptosyltransferase-1/heptosyltransferase-2 [Singulisphaera sp. GP187]
MVRPLHELRDLHPARVCIIKPSALGDVVNAFSALSALRAIWPQARISWVINASLRGLVDGHPELDDVVIYDRARTNFRPRGIATFARFLAQLRNGRYDLAIDLQGLLRSGLMAAATRAPIRVGLADAREGASLFYTHRVTPPPSATHAVDRLLSIAESFGADIASPRFVVAAGEVDRAWARQVLSDVPTPRLMLNMGARWQTKQWPPEHFAEVARRAIALYGAGLVVVGAPEDRPIVDAFRRQLGTTPVVDLCGRTTLPQLAAASAAVDLVLSNDSGPLHLATAAGARVVGIYTCTSPALNGPYGPNATAVETKVWCAASYVTTCSRLECFAELTPDRVWSVVATQLATRKSLPSPAA